MTTLYL